MGIRDIKWEIGPNLPELRKGACTTELGGKVISAFGMRQPWGERNTVYIYDPSVDWWFRAPNAPVGQCYVQGCRCGSSFFSIGGRGALEEMQTHPACFRLDLDENGNHIWTRIADLNDSRGWAPSASIGSRIYVCGGLQGAGGPTVETIEMLDTAVPNAKWEVVSKFPDEPRGNAGVEAVDGKIYIFGGIHWPVKDEENKRYASVLEFDPASGSWTEKASLPFRFHGMGTCVYKERYVILVGGRVLSEDYSDELRKLWQEEPTHLSYDCPFIMIYDTQTDTWHRMPTLMTFPTADIGVVLFGRKIYALGGENIEPATSNTTAWLRIGEIIE